MEIKELDHMGDALFEIRGGSLSECFIGAAVAFLGLTYDLNRVSTIQEITVEVTGDDLENLLYRWLEKLLILLTADGFAAGRIDVLELGNNRIRARLFGEAYSREKHGFKTEVKGITYHMMSVKSNGGCVMTFLADL